MSDSVLLFRSLIVYAVCLPLAVLLGYLSATPEDIMSLGLAMTAVFLLMIPLLLRWHHFWLIVAWNMPAVVFFLPGRPEIMLAMCGISFLVSVLQHIVNRNQKFIHVPALFWPLMFLCAVVVVTAELTGGIGTALTGSETYGGKRYIVMLGTIVGYFALTAHRIPPRKVGFYVALFFLSALAGAISNLTSFVGPSAFYYILLLVPPQSYWNPVESVSGPVEIQRLGGVALASTAVFSFMLARYGIRGIFTSRKIWRFAVLTVFTIAALFGGYRSILIGFMLTFALLFWLEGLMRSRLLVGFVLFGVFAAAVVLPYTEQLPLSVQRTLSFIPFVQVSQDAEENAAGSTKWRLDMWKEVLPEVPAHLLLGKGLSIDPAALLQVETEAFRNADTPNGAILAGDYHSGPLSVILPFGIPGVIAFFWLIAAGVKVLHHNYLYGDPAFKTVNTFLLASFVSKTIFFLGVFGSFYSDLAVFVGMLGLSVSINNGMRRPAPARARAAGNLNAARRVQVFPTRAKANA